MKRAKKNKTDPGDKKTRLKSQHAPKLLIPYCFGEIKKGSTRFPLSKTVTVGRLAGSDIRIDDNWLSRAHFRLSIDGGVPVVEDLRSTNGTYVNGIGINPSRELNHGDIIRAGRCLFVYFEDPDGALEATQNETFGIKGDFFAAPVVARLKALAGEKSDVLISGPPGTDKTAVVQAFATIARQQIVRLGASPAGNEDELASKLFGKTYNGGLLATARGRTVLIEDIHLLSERFQIKLLEALEMLSEAGEKESPARIILTTDVAPPDYGLIQGLMIRTRAVVMQPLFAHVADIPSLFLNALDAAISRRRVGNFDRTIRFVHADHYESLCLDGFKRDNLLGLEHLADQVAANLAQGLSPEIAVSEVFEKRYNNSPILCRVYGKSSLLDHDKDELTTSTREFMVLKERRDREEQRLMDEINLDRTTLELIKEAHIRCDGVCHGMSVYLKERYDVDIPKSQLAMIVEKLNLPVEETWYL